MPSGERNKEAKHHSIRPEGFDKPTKTVKAEGCTHTKKVCVSVSEDKNAPHIGKTSYRTGRA